MDAMRCLPRGAAVKIKDPKEEKRLKKAAEQLRKDVEKLARSKEKARTPAPPSHPTDHRSGISHSETTANGDLRIRRGKRKEERSLENPPLLDHRARAGDLPSHPPSRAAVLRSSLLISRGIALPPF